MLSKDGRNRVLKSLVLYMVHLLLAAIALLMSTQLTVDTPTHPSSTMCDVLQALLVLSNTGMLYSEFRQLWMHEAGFFDAVCEYLGSGWNIIDVVGIMALYIAAAGHFLRLPFVVQQVGAVGVLANAFSLLQLLQPFPLTGALIKIITSTITSQEVVGFMSVVAVLIWGFSAAFAVSNPTNEAFCEYRSARSCHHAVI